MSRAVFLTGFWRSGTNATVFALNKHQEVTLYNENNPEAFENWRLKDLDIIEKLCSSHKKSKISLFKPVSEPDRISEYLNLGRESKVIYLYRLPENVCKSGFQNFGEEWSRIHRQFIKKLLEGKEPYSKYNSEVAYHIREQAKLFYTESLNNESVIILRWLLSNQFFLRCNFKSNKNVLTISYEELTTEPINIFQKICNFLEIEYDSLITEGIHSYNRHKFEIKIDEKVRLAAEECYHKLKQ